MYKKRLKIFESSPILLFLMVSGRQNHYCKKQVPDSVLRIRIRCLFDPRIQDPGSRMDKKPGSGSGIQKEQPGSYFLELWNHFLGLKFFDAAQDPGWKKSVPGWKNSVPG
jgi:hypothetical protein